MFYGRSRHLPHQHFVPGANRLTTYTNKPLRMVVNPSEHLRETRWERSGDT